jgi:hypothetical protein
LGVLGVLSVTTTYTLLQENKPSWMINPRFLELQKKALWVDDDNSHNLRFIRDFLLKKNWAGVLVAEK